MFRDNWQFEPHTSDLSIDLCTVRPKLIRTCLLTRNELHCPLQFLDKSPLRAFLEISTRIRLKAACQVSAKEPLNYRDLFACTIGAAEQWKEAAEEFRWERRKKRRTVIKLNKCQEQWGGRGGFYCDDKVTDDPFAGPFSSLSHKESLQHLWLSLNLYHWPSFKDSESKN